MQPELRKQSCWIRIKKLAKGVNQQKVQRGVSTGCCTNTQFNSPAGPSQAPSLPDPALYQPITSTVTQGS